MYVHAVVSYGMWHWTGEGDGSDFLAYLQAFMQGIHNRVATWAAKGSGIFLNLF